MWARLEFSVVIMPCFDLGFYKALQKGGVGTVTIKPEKTVWEKTGGWIKTYDHWTNSHKKCHRKTFCTFTLLHYTKTHLSRYCCNLFDPCLAFACARVQHQITLSWAKQDVLPNSSSVSGTRTTTHLLGSAGTFLTSFPLQPEAFLHPPFLMEKKMASSPRQGDPIQVRAGVPATRLWGAPLFQAPSQPHRPNTLVTFTTEWQTQTENTIEQLIYFHLLLMTFHDFHNSASLRHSWVMRSSVTQGNKWSFPSAYCISPFITFLLPTFKVLSPSILFYSGITFRCRDVYESSQTGSVQLGFTGRRAMLTHRHKRHFF